MLTAVLESLLVITMPLLAVFLILLILVQRGRGGGLAGALGGMGGQSAFGTKAGDLFTKITIVTATIWILVCMLGVKHLTAGNKSLLKGAAQTAPTAPGGGAVPGGTGAEGGAATETPGQTPGGTGQPSQTPAEPGTTPPAGETQPDDK